MLSSHLKDPVVLPSTACRLSEVTSLPNSVIALFHSLVSLQVLFLSLDRGSRAVSRSTAWDAAPTG
jgi:hypothetical protein